MKVLDSWHSPVLRERAQAYAFDDGNFADFEFTPSAE
jgi:hypothetical protein